MNYILTLCCKNGGNELKEGGCRTHKQCSENPKLMMDQKPWSSMVHYYEQCWGTRYRNIFLLAVIKHVYYIQALQAYIVHLFCFSNSHGVKSTVLLIAEMTLSPLTRYLRLLWDEVEGAANYARYSIRPFSRPQFPAATSVSSTDGRRIKEAS